MSIKLTLHLSSVEAGGDRIWNILNHAGFMTGYQVRETENGSCSLSRLGESIGGSYPNTGNATLAAAQDDYWRTKGERGRLAR